jgi:hypothetical protein
MDKKRKKQKQSSDKAFVISDVSGSLPTLNEIESKIKEKWDELNPMYQGRFESFRVAFNEGFNFCKNMLIGNDR